MFFLKPIIAFVVLFTLATLGHTNGANINTAKNSVQQAVSNSSAHNSVQNIVSMGVGTPANNSQVTTPSTDQNQGSSSNSINITQNDSTSSSSSSSNSVHITETINGQTISSSAQSQNNPAATTSGSGVKGTALIMPACTVAQAATCDQKLINQVIITNSSTGAEVTRFVPNPGGSFTIQLPPGSYKLSPRQASTNSSSSFSQTYGVTVLPNSYAQVSMNITDY